MAHVRLSVKLTTGCADPRGMKRRILQSRRDGMNLAQDVWATLSRPDDAGTDHSLFSMSSLLPVVRSPQGLNRLRKKSLLGRSGLCPDTQPHHKNVGVAEGTPRALILPMPLEAFQPPKPAPGGTNTVFPRVREQELPDSSLRCDGK
jgi:hypothetical protein